jgi:hypothetical protein
LKQRKNKIVQATAANERFGAMSALPRRQFCGKWNVITPQEIQWKPPLRQAAGTLAASGGDSAAGQEIRKFYSTKIAVTKVNKAENLKLDIY